MLAAAVGLSILMLSTVPAAVAAAPESLQQAVAAVRSQYRIPGLVVVVVNKAGIEQVETQGLSADAALPIGSTSKQFTGLILQQLVAQGRLSLDQRLDAVLPEAAGSAFAAVTMAQLLSHRSGLLTGAGAEWNIWPPVTTIRDEARRLLAGSPASTPGSEFVYSNANYTLLGAVIEAITDASYADALQGMVAGPLALQHTTADLAQARAASVAGHYPWLGGIVAETPQPQWPLAAPSAMVSSTANDLATVARAHLGGSAAVSPQVLAAAREPLNREDEWLEYASGLERRAFWQLSDENLGWQDPALPVWFEHHGNTLRTFSYLGFSPDHDLGVALLGDTSFGIDQDAQGVVVDRIIHAIVQTKAAKVAVDPLIAAGPAIMVLVPLAQAAALVWLARSRRLLPALVALAVSLVTAALCFWVVPQRTDTRVFSSAFLASVPDLAISLWLATALAGGAVLLVAVRTIRAAFLR